MASLTPDLKASVEKWLEWNKNEEDEKRVKLLMESGDTNALTKAFSERIKFGTAGLRGAMDVGPANMNDVTVIQASQGLLHVVKAHQEKRSPISVVVGFDGRRNSKRFAQFVTSVFVHGGALVYGFGDHLVPTPLVPFTVKLKNASCGVMITASHNPKNDNGYKVYWSNGAQIVTPLDKEIEAAIAANLQPRYDSWEDVGSSPVRLNVYDEVKRQYLQHVNMRLNFLRGYDFKKPVTMKFTYTAMHGVGYELVSALFAELELPLLIPVVEQCEPDGDFPTVEFPNPEEGESVLDLAMKTASKHGSRVILANDPDADRIALAYKPEHSDEWRVFSGNELGTLLAWWMWTNWVKKNPAGNPSRVHMISSTVSSSIMATMAAMHGFHHHETLTGFKWMGNLAYEIERSGETVLLAFEEAIGFMCGTDVLDKDGVSAAAVIAQMMLWLDDNGRSAEEQLDTIYSRYGLHMCKTIYLISPDPKATESMFVALRQYQDGELCDDMCYPKQCGPYKIARIRDLTTGKEFTLGSDGLYHRPELPSSSSSQMITFYLRNGSKVTLRTSGTEPKIKCYVEIKTSPDSYSSASKHKYKEEMDTILKAVVDNFYMPEKNHFITPKSQQR